MAAPTNLRVEHLDMPFGITIRKPRFSWHLPGGSGAQEAYQVRAGEWDSGRVESDASVLVRYDGPPLRSGESVEWTVRVWTSDGRESEWAEPSSFEMGLLELDDWVARWVEPVETAEVRASTPRPAYLLRGTLTLDHAPARGRLYATAHGIYELFVNGTRVGDAELTPGFTSYHSNLQVQAFDVTDLLTTGENVVGAVLSDGWFRGQDSGFRLTNVYGDTVALLAQLDVETADGSFTRTGTGPSWTWHTSSILAADLFEGQTVDLRQDIPGWCTPEVARDNGWAPVAVADHDRTRLLASAAPPVRRVEEIRPVSVTLLRPGVQIVDLGQNINGWLRLNNLGPADTTLTITYGEALDPDGDVTQEHLLPDPHSSTYLQDPVFVNITRPFQVDRVTSAGREGETFEPRHTTHGFRYARIEGHPDMLGPDEVTGVVVHTDLRRTGWFTCSDERINRLHDAAVWSFRGNACDIPTDCPTRERAGWTGDWQIFVPTAAFLYDVAGFSAKWLRDLAAEQQPNGIVHHCAPETMSDDIMKKIGAPHGSAGWGDAAVIVPWEIYKVYGDRELLVEQYESMVAWFEYAYECANTRRHPDRAANRPQPNPYEVHIWDTGYHWGEWLEPDEWEPDIIAKLGAADHGAIATAYMFNTARLLMTMANHLGYQKDAVRFHSLAAAIQYSWRLEFANDDGTLTPHTQANYARVLALDILPDEMREQAANHLVQLIRDADTHLGTGFLATPFLLPVLADTGHLDLAYELLFQNTPPSWLTMIDRGATTIWEDWNGIDDDGNPHLSLNHYSKGAVISFLHRYTAGIQARGAYPGYKRFRIKPHPGGGITHATATHDSPRGRIISTWNLDNDATLTLEVTVPPNSTADVILPDGQEHEAAPGTSTYTCSVPQTKTG